MKNLILILLTSFVLVGCCQPEIRYVDRPVEVYVEVEKKLVPPEKPIKGANHAESLLNVLKYKDKLQTIVVEHSK